jgi:hypothetical protein
MLFSFLAVLFSTAYADTTANAVGFILNMPPVKDIQLSSYSKIAPCVLDVDLSQANGLWIRYDANSLLVLCRNGTHTLSPPRLTVELDVGLQDYTLYLWNYSTSISSYSWKTMQASITVPNIKMLSFSYSTPSIVPYAHRRVS